MGTRHPTATIRSVQVGPRCGRNRSAIRSGRDPVANTVILDKSQEDSRGACYRSLLAETARALASLRQTHQPRLVALVWIQGESDATAGRAETYRVNLEAMISSLRKDLAAPNLIALLGLNTEFGGGNNPHLPDVIEAQKAYAQSDDRARYVDTAGASIANNVHFDAAGTLDVGQRFADVLSAVLQHP